MIIPTPIARSASDAAQAALFESAAPVLVEVRFPHMGTAPDWYLCQDRGELDSIVERLGSGVELHLHSVWDLENRGRALVIGK